MRTKTVNAILRKKFDDWVESIEDDAVRSLVKRDTIITGGCITSLLQTPHEMPKDYDVYFTNKGTVLAVANYYAEQFNKRNENHKNALGGAAKAFVLDGEDVEGWKEGLVKLSEFAPDFTNQRDRVSRMIVNTPPDRVKMIVRSDGVAAEDGQENVFDAPFDDALDVLDTADDIEYTEEDDGERYRPVFLSTNAITLSNKIQLVIRFYGNPEQIHENYDFIHCTNYWTPHKGLVTNKKALESILAKELVYSGSKYPLCSVIRTRKFINRGWRINAGQYLKMCMQISELNLKDIDVLEDQLVGVDSMYFMHLIDQFRRQQEQGTGLDISSTYVASIIDKIF